MGLQQSLALGEQSYQEKAPLNAVLYPMMWSGINAALTLRAGKAVVGHSDSLLTSQSTILLAIHFIRALSCLLLNSPLNELLQMTLLPPNYFIF